MSFRYVTPIIWSFLIIIIAGCAARPPRTVPHDLTVSRVLEVLEERQNRIRDFSAGARVTAVTNGVPENATLLVRYLAPDRLRVYIKGFVGIDVARVSVLSDSVVVWILPDNYFFRVHRESLMLAGIVPELGVGFDTIAAAFASTLPPASDRDRYVISLERGDATAVLVLAGDGVVRRIYLEGPDLLIRREDISHGGEIILTKSVESYRSVDGVSFPARVTVGHGSDTMTLSFSDITLNLGFREDDLLFSIPPSVRQVWVGSQP